MQVDAELMQSIATDRDDYFSAADFEALYGDSSGSTVDRRLVAQTCRALPRPAFQGWKNATSRQ